MLTAHAITPIIYLVEDQLTLFSAEPSMSKGGEQTVYLWRLQEDIFGKFLENPPWRSTYSAYIVKPFMRISTGHEAPISSITYSARSNVLITASLDGSIKFWEISGNPIKFEEVKRVYTDHSAYIHASVQNVIIAEGSIPV